MRTRFVPIQCFLASIFLFQVLLAQQYHKTFAPCDRQGGGRGKCNPNLDDQYKVEIGTWRNDNDTACHEPGYQAQEDFIRVIPRDRQKWRSDGCITFLYDEDREWYANNLTESANFLRFNPSGDVGNLTSLSFATRVVYQDDVCGFSTWPDVEKSTLRCEGRCSDVALFNNFTKKISWRCQVGSQEPGIKEAWEKTKRLGGCCTDPLTCSREKIFQERFDQVSEWLKKAKEQKERELLEQMLRLE